MKKNRDTKPKTRVPTVRQVHVEFVNQTATTVCIAGTFNDWRPEATHMVSLGAGRWAKDLVLPPGIYEYRLVVDGEWMPDPTARETAQNPYGGMNSVLKVNGDADHHAEHSSGQEDQ